MKPVRVNREYKIKNGNIFACIEVRGEKRELFSLNFNDRREMFYIFPSDSTQLANVLQGNKWSVQRRDDHVSFHRDGNIHTMHKEKKRKSKSYRFNARNNTNVFDLGDDSIMALMIHTFYFGDIFDTYQDLNESDGSILLERVNSEFPVVDFEKNTITWQLDRIHNFSIITLVLGRKLNPVTLTDPLVRSLVNQNYMQPILLPWGTPEQIPTQPKVWLVFSSKFMECPEEHKHSIEEKTRMPDLKAWPLYSYGVCPPWSELRKLV